MSEHPSAIVLDALSVGDHDEAAERHVEGCDACKAYIASLRDELGESPSRGEAEAFVRGLGKRARSAPPSSETPSNVVRLFPRVAFAVASVAAAAAVFFVMHRPAPVGEGEGIAPPSSAVRFKGGMQVAVIRERAGEQSRLVADVDVAPNDALRLELAIADERPITAGILTDKGEWVVLEPPTSLPPGTHYSTLSARFDESPDEGFVLVGHPDAVAHARQTRDFTGVVARRIRRSRDAGEPTKLP